ncbi:hypothetical protein C8R46DRAFT_1091069 [Mycena filopes]|nr:hypothetical protein C8R46DRAFT_1091069 [Mycena filopes]
MSSTLSHDSPRAWWSLGQKAPSPTPDFPSEKPSSHSKQSGIKLHSLATAMGFKPKKNHPPPLTLLPTVATSTTTLLAPRIEPHQRRPTTAPSVGIGRAPSNSVSSFRSRADSIEPSTPKTPEDLTQNRRGSLLTLSDSDPFAARVVSLHSPSSPSDPNRLSAFSNSSVNDAKSNESANRVSYASSSSHSFRMAGDLSPLSILSPASEAGSSYMRLSNKLSGHSLRRKNDETWLSNLGAESNRFSQPDPPPKPRPVMRARGMTDTGIEPRTNFLRSDPFVSRSPKSSSTGYQASSPSIPARQISLSRPSPPPSHDLPPPPSASADDRLQRHSAGTASTSSLTFSSEFSPISPRAKGKQQAYDASPRAGESGWEPDAPRHRTLKKSVSHQSLKRGPSSSISIPSSAPLPEMAPLKVPRKQRSFHQHRLPVPAVPLQLPISEQRTPDPAQSTRKRLFSASSSRRPSQSTLALTDDVRPVSEQESVSCWIDTDQPPRSPSLSAQEYTPQQIMSPAEMLKVEASVDAAYQRPRTGSILSARSTALSDFETDFGLSPSASFGGGRKRSTSVRSNATSTDQYDYYDQQLPPQPPSPPVLMSLPPPPRRTARPSISRSQSDVVAPTPLSPPPRKNIRPKISVEERMHRHSIMRKSSFLNIEDEMDKEPRSLPTKGSFLDLTRGSFDSMRSDDSDY